MTDHDLQAIAARNEERKRLKAAATEPPWSSYGPTEHAGLCYVGQVPLARGPWVADVGNASKSLEDSVFIAAARNDPVEADVDALLAEVQALRAALNDAPPPTARPSDYDDDSYCDHCDLFTPHRIHESGHERDSSGDMRTCKVCGWTWHGLTGKYAPP
jgi:hypothetical protein